MVDGKQLTVDGERLTDNLTGNGKRLTVNGRQLTVLAISLILLVSFVTVAIATGFFGINTTKVSSLEKGLVGHYPLDGVYQTKDVTPYSNHGTNYGATLTTGVKDEPNGAYSFDGNDYIDLGRPEVQNFIPRIDEFSISVWYKSTKIGVIYSFGGSTSIRQIQIDFTESNIELYLGQNIGNQNKISIELTPGYRDGKWHHVAIVIPASSTGGKFYYDGNLITSALNIGSGTAANNAYIGARTDGTGYPLTGAVADLRIYNRQLSDDEIKLLFDSYKPKASASDLNKGLVGHWMLDAENGAKDLTPYGNHGTAQGGITIGGAEDRKGKSGGATSFDGVDDYIGLSSSENNHLDLRKDLTMSAWVYANSFGTYNYVISKGNTGGFADQQYSIATSGVTPTICIGGTQMDTSTPLSKNKWYLLTATLDGGILRYYLNGEYIKQLDVSGTTITYKPNMNIGVRSSTGSSKTYFWNGLISDVRIYNRALSEDEIKLLFDSYKPKEANVGNLNKGLILDMPLTTKWMKSSTIVSDRTPYGNDGTLMNGVNVTNEGAVFDGVNDYVEISDNTDLRFVGKPLTISVWVYPTGSGSGDYSRIIDKKVDYTGASAGYYLCLRDNGKLAVSFGNSYDEPVTLSKDNWQHIVAYADGDKWKVYINGVSVWSKSTSQLPASSTRPIMIGDSSASSYLGTRNFQGTISNVRIYNRALSDEEISLLYEKGRW